MVHHPARAGGGPCPRLLFEIAPEYHSLGWAITAPSLTNGQFRSRIDRDPAPMEKLASSAGSTIVLEGEMYKRPKGTPAPCSPWYNRKTSP